MDGLHDIESIEKSIELCFEMMNFMLYELCWNTEVQEEGNSLKLVQKHVCESTLR